MPLLSCLKLVLILPTPEGWKAESTSLVGYIPRWFTRSKTVTHPGPMSVNFVDQNNAVFHYTTPPARICNTFGMTMIEG